ncbi:uncharacterized protein LOC124944966 [Impatiens glandulifera]|uniref:uncharacterized protein LOC124944966 n=1 Tax=Impatiens glandulifera TaxID=253017 RepID=UPI001FB18B81|nr:uncharacterized protein LOC124944966 [Impatiens glandulifera]
MGHVRQIWDRWRSDLHKEYIRIHKGDEAAAIEMGRAPSVVEVFKRTRTPKPTKENPTPVLDDRVQEKIENNEVDNCFGFQNWFSFVYQPLGITLDAKTDDGEIIDCVDIYKQRAFDHPLINDLQMEPSHYPYGNKLDSNLTLETFQDWHKNEECPEGTIPVRRNKSTDNFYPKKFSRIMQHQFNQSVDHDDGHEYAVVTDHGSSYYGASGIFNVWNPKTEDKEFSLSQMWVVSSYDKGDFYNNINSIEVGWAVNPINYKDKQTRLFIYWTSDGYTKKGCYDLNCNGFVQTSRTYSLGMPITRVSKIGGETMQISINIFKDKTGDKWWLQVQGSILGYWPTVIFTDLKNNANMVQWGGEIVNQKTNGHHTTTQMGSGEFPNKGFSKSCFIHSLKVLDDGLIPRNPGYLVKTISKPACYDLTLTKDQGTTFETHIFYGGSGFSPTCQ